MVPPLQVLRESEHAAASGFEGLFIPDHFHPWTVARGTPFAWTLIASVAERTHNVVVGSAVTCPYLRYNPAIVAQAFATLGATYEGRIFLGVGTGEALNEVPVGCSWPRGPERLERLEEAVHVIRMLWTREYVTFEGKYYKLDKANLFTKPAAPIPIYVSGFGPKATELAGSIGDGWFTGGLPDDYLRGELIPALEKGIRKSGQDKHDMERIVEVLISYDEDIDKAVESTRMIAGAMAESMQKAGIHDPRELKKMADQMESSDLAQTMMAFDDPDRIISKLETYVKMGFTWIELGSLSPDNKKFIDVFGKRILPYMKEEFKA